MNKDFLKKAVELSKESFQQGRFPSGAVLARNSEIIDTAISGLYPHIHFHAETMLIDEAMVKYNKQLEDFELYTSMEPCIMCLGKMYWSGINKIAYVLSRKDVDEAIAYEGKHSTKEIISKFNRPIKLVQDKTYYKEALEIYKKWESGFRVG